MRLVWAIFGLGGFVSMWVLVFSWQLLRAPSLLHCELEGEIRDLKREKNRADVGNAPHLVLKADDPEARFRHFYVINTSPVAAYTVSCDFDPSNTFKLEAETISHIPGHSEVPMKTFAKCVRVLGESIVVSTTFDCYYYIHSLAGEGSQANFTAKIQYREASGQQFVSHMNCVWDKVTDRITVMLDRVERVSRDEVPTSEQDPYT